MAENALDDALADLVEAFGSFSEAELQAFLDATPCSDAPLTVPPSKRIVFDWSTPAGVAPSEVLGVVQAARA